MPVVDGYMSPGTAYTERFKGLFPPVANSALDGTLHGYIDGWMWRKCAAGCGHYVSHSQTTQPLFDPDVSTLRAYLRIPKVYVDKTRFYVVFQMTDSFGSPRFSARDVSITLSGVGLYSQYLTGVTCETGSALGGSQYASTQWLYYCAGDAATSQFSHLAWNTVPLEITASFGDRLNKQIVGGADAPVNQLVFATKPDWWHATLRSDQDAQATWAAPRVPTQPTVITLPTYPLYPNEEFDVKIYNYASYPLGDVSSLSFTATYDSSIVEYVSFSQNENLGTFTEDTNVAGQVSFASVNANAGMNSFFRFATLRFRVSSNQGPTTDLGTSTGIYVLFTSVANSGQNYVTSQHYSSVYDFRQEATYGGSGTGESATGGGNTGAAHVRVASVSDRAAFLHPDPHYASSQDHGRIFNYRSIDGQNHDNVFETTVITDRMSFAESNTALQYVQRDSSICSARNGSYYDTDVLSSANVGKCTVRLRADAKSDSPMASQIEATTTGTCNAQVGGTCKGIAKFTVVSPSGIVMNVTDTTLNKMRPLANTTCGGSWPLNSAYQTASVRVYADGYDVTSLATGLFISTADLAVADFVGTDAGEDIKSRVRGKSVGTFTLKLYDDTSMSTSAPSVAMTVSDTPVSVTHVVAKVITDVTWLSNPSPSYTYPAEFSASVLVSQILTRRPAGTTPGHYGYLFMTLTFDDGASEEVDADGITVDNQSPNVHLIAPGDVDTHTGVDDLRMENDDTDRWMVTIANTAVTECIESTVRTNFSRCGELVASGYPTMYVKIPEPVFMTFNISASGGAPGAPDSSKTLTPVNGGAAFAPFLGVDTITTSNFKVTVFLDDGSSVDTYAEEPDSSLTQIVYYSMDTSCATVDNAANTVTVVQDATCDFVEVGANVTINGRLFQDVDTAPVVRLVSVETVGAVYPSGAARLTTSTHVYRLPCGADYERHTLASYGALSTGVERQIDSAHITYVSSDPAVVTVSGSTVMVTVPVNNGSSSLGGTCAEFYANAWSDCAGVMFRGLSFAVNTSEPLRSYSDTYWGGLPGGTGDLSYPYSSSTLNLVKDGTSATTFRLSYVRSGMDGTKTVTFDNVLSGFGDWFDYTDIVSFYAWSPTLISVSSAGVLVLKENSHLPHRVQSFVCAAASASASASAPTSYDVASPVTPKYIWANLKPDYEDIDIGSSSAIDAFGATEQYSPFYMPNPGTVWILYVGVRPALSFPWLRSAEFTITFSSGVSTVGSTFTQASSGVGSEYEVSVNPNFFDDGRTLKVSAVHPGTIGTSEYVYLGYWSVPASGTLSLSGDHGSVVTSIDLIQSASYASCNSDSCLTSKTGTDASAGSANLYAGPISGRRQLNGQIVYMGPISPPKRRNYVEPRRLQACDPCTSAVYGDANGDCILRIDDAVKIIEMIGSRATFQAGTSNLDPLDAASTCAHTKLQYNPLYNLMDVSNAFDSRYGKAEVGITDAVHVLRGTTGSSRFIQPTVECVASHDTLSHLPDALIRSSVFAIKPADATTPTAIRSATRVYFDIVIAGRPLAQYSSQLFTVTNGTIVRWKDNTMLSETTYYAPAGPVTTHSVVVEATYDVHYDQWVARIKPFGYVGNVSYHVAVVTESYIDGIRCFPDCYGVWLGSTMPPFGSDDYVDDLGSARSGFHYNFKGVIGDPLSSIQTTATTCMYAHPLPTPMSSPPPPLPPPPSSSPPSPLSHSSPLSPPSSLPPSSLPPPSPHTYINWTSILIVTATCTCTSMCLCIACIRCYTTITALFIGGRRKPVKYVAKRRRRSTLSSNV